MKFIINIYVKCIKVISIAQPLIEKMHIIILVHIIAIKFILHINILSLKKKLLLKEEVHMRAKLPLLNIVLDADYISGFLFILYCSLRNRYFVLRPQPYFVAAFLDCNLYLK